MNYAPGSSIMPFDETSRISRMASTIAHSVESYFESSESSTFDRFFLIIDELGRCSPPNSILTLIQFIILGYQYYISFYFAFLNGKWDFTKMPDKILRYLTYPVDFGLGDSNIFTTGIVSYILLILSLLIIIYLVSIYFYFHQNKMFPRHNAHITRFVFSLLIPILLPPSCYNIGFSYNSIFAGRYKTPIDSNFTSNIYYSIDSKTSFFHKETIELNAKPLFIASTVFGLIFYAILTFIFYIDVKFRSSTPYLENTVFAMWDGRSLFEGIFGCTMSILSSAIVEPLPEWSRIFLLICSIFYNVYVLTGIFIFPMVKHWMNVSVSSLVSGTIVTSLFQLFPIDSIYRLCIPIGVLVIFFPIYYFIFRHLRRKFAHIEVDEADLSTERKCLRYLRLSIADRCADFATFKWVRKMNQVDTTGVICQVAQMISFFPTESQNLTFYISILSKRSGLSLHQRFLLFQLRRVHVLRQSNTSKQLNEDLEEISKVTNQSIASFSQFLIKMIDERQEISLDSLAALARLNRTTSSLCHEAMARYPNNSRLLFIFSRYVIECQADFKAGISLYQEGKMIDNGKRPAIDFAFRSMVNLFPNYLWKRILDYRGRSILSRRRHKSGSSMSNDSQSNERNFGSDTDVESNEKVASSVIDNPKLRLSLKKAVSNMNSNAILIMTFSLIIRIILSFVACFVIIGVASTFLNDRSINYQNIAQIATVRKCVDLSLFRMAKLWSLNLKLSPTQEDVTASLGPDISIEEFNNVAPNSTDILFSDVFESIQAIEKLGELLSTIKYQDSMELSDKSSTDFVQFNNISFCSSKLNRVFQSSTSIRYFSLYLLSQIVTVSRFPGKYSNPWEWKEDESLCEVILNMQNIIDALNSQSTVLVNQEEDYSNAMKNKIIFVFCIIIPVVFAIYFVPFIVGYVKMNSEFKQVFDVLNLLPIKIYKEASKPIAKFQTDGEIIQEGISHITVKGCQKISIVIPPVLSSIIITGSLIGIFFLISDVNVKFFSIVKWLEIGSRRTPLLIETVTNGILAGIFGYIGPTEYTNHVVHLSNVFNYSQRLLYQHKTLIWGSDDSTSCNNFTKRLDDLHFSNTCAINFQGDSLQMNYKCMSVDQQVMTFNKFAKDAYLAMIYAQVNSNDSSNSTGNDRNDAFLNILNGYEMINLHFLGISYLLPKLEEGQSILNELINLKIDQLSHYSLIISICTLAAQIILFIVDIFMINNLKDEFNIVKILIARLPPISVVRNQSIVELITGQSDTLKTKKSSPIEICIKYGSNPIIAFNKMCKIQLVNKATTEVFGFTKEQLFNTHLSTVIERENTLQIQDKCNKNCQNIDDQKGFKSTCQKNDPISKKETELLDDAKKDAIISSLLNSSDTDDIDLNNKKCNNENQNCCQNVDLYNCPFSMTIIGMKDDGTKIILKSVLTYLPPPDDVYVLIMKDETQVYINKNEITNSRMRASSIKMNVLPPEIYQNENIKENISFSLKLVCVITVRILNFNESVMNFTSVQSIRNMAELFTIFDEQLVKYQNLTKTLVISEAYQAIGGLFNGKSIRKCPSRADGNVEDENTEGNNNVTESNKSIKLTKNSNNNDSTKSFKGTKLTKNGNNESTKSVKSSGVDKSGNNKLTKNGNNESTKSVKSETNKLTKNENNESTKSVKSENNKLTKNGNNESTKSVKSNAVEKAESNKTIKSNVSFISSESSKDVYHLVR